jgi:hypothetical protein
MQEEFKELKHITKKLQATKKTKAKQKARTKLLETYNINKI